jgi:hypothetical protein
LKIKNLPETEDVFFGDKSVADTEFTPTEMAEIDAEEGYDDENYDKPTPPDVIAVLGFDPMEEDLDDLELGDGR